jgi:hypothetical protein
MAYFKYSESYRETNLRTGDVKEFKREFEISGTKDEVKELTWHAFSLMPRYRYPVLAAREDVFKKAFEHLDVLKLIERGNE